MYLFALDIATKNPFLTAARLCIRMLLPVCKCQVERRIYVYFALVCVTLRYGAWAAGRGQVLDFKIFFFARTASRNI